MQFVWALTALCVVAAAAANAGNHKESECRCVDDSAIDCGARDKHVIRPDEIDCPNATVANLSNNHLTEFPDGLQHVTHVLADYNNLTRLPPASLLSPNITTLVMKNNRISGSSEGFDSLSSLEEIRLDYNDLKSVDFLPKPCNVKILSLLTNNITSLDGIQSCTQLTHLYVSSGRTSYLDTTTFNGTENLEELWLMYQKVSSVADGAFQYLKKLKVLRLFANSPIRLTIGMFEGLSALESLDLSMCEIRALPAGLFTHTPRLEVIDLSINKLKTLQPDIFSGLHWLRDINVGLNNLTDLPTFRNCCAHLESYKLYGNQIRHPSEDSFRTLLQGNLVVELDDNPIPPQALNWLLHAADVTSYLTQCNCGGIRLDNASASFCVVVECGTQDTVSDWKAAVLNYTG